MSDLVARVVSDAPSGGPVDSPRNPNRLVQEVSAGASSRVEGVRQTVSVQSGAVPGDVVQQVISSGPGSDLSRNQQGVTLNLAAEPVFFDLYIVDVSTKSHLQPGEALQPDRSYSLHIAAAPSPFRRGQRDELKQTPVRTRTDLRLFLQVSGDPLAAAAVQLNASQPLPFPAKEARTWFFDFPFATSAALPGGSVALKLEYTGENNYTPLLAAELKINLAQTGAPLPPTELRALLMGQATPPRTVVLSIQSAADGEKISFQIWAPEVVGRRIDIEPVPSPELPNIDAGDSNRYPRYLQELYNRLNNFAVSNQAGLAAWLSDLAKRYTGEFNLWIMDESDKQLPWEMFPIGEERYLGIVANVVRVAEIQYYTETISLLAPVELDGRLAVFVDPSDQPLISEAPLLDQLDPDRQTEPEDLLVDLLTTQPHPVGLAYLSHAGLVLAVGQTSPNLQALHWLVDAPKPVEIDFTFVPIPKTSRPLFFVNAPYSAWVFQKSAGECLACVALAQAAAGFLGLIGPIFRTDAARFAQRLLDIAVSNPGITLSQLLRQLRIEAYEELKLAQQKLKTGEIKSDAYKMVRNQMFSAFMYVYYGSPSATLRLRKP